jgi:hypothetical protein
MSGVSNYVILRRVLFCTLFLLLIQPVFADDKPIVGLIPKAQHPIVMDGKLDEWDGAFVTPLNATHPDFKNRATHIYYLWDDDALYIGVRALDTNPTHISNENALYDGDAVEFYLDTRHGDDLGNPDWAPGTLHAFFTAITGHEIKPRFHIRDLPAFRGLTLKGVEVAAERTPTGYTLEFKLPWMNFPNFKPEPNTPIGIDIEMGSADGGHRVHRTFAYSSPTSVSTPSTHGRVMLVDKIDAASVKPYSRALFPFDAQLPGNYGRIYGVACVSPTIAGVVTRITARLLDGAGAVRKNAENSTLTTVDDFWRMWRGEWETFDLPAGTYTLVVTAQDAQNNVIVERRMRVLLEQ